jgi:hypothetical protein
MIHSRALLLLSSLGACAEHPVAVSQRLPPAVLSVAVAPNANNVLSAAVTVRVSRADSVVVRYHVVDAVANADSVTPAARVVADSVVVPLFGLVAGRAYTARPVVFGSGAPLVGDATPFSTAELPTDLPHFDASGSDPSPGFVVFAAGKYGIVIDNTGRVVWYKRFPNGPGLAFMAQPTGRYVVRPPTPDPTDIEPWLELDEAGDVVRTLGCANGFQTRPHDLLLENGGSYWILCDETRTMDLSTLGGFVGARVTGTVVQHVGPSGALLFQWSPFDHFDIADADPADRRNANVNWTHGNALDVDSQGDVYVSFRNQSEITKIDTKTGAVVWRMGGVRNQFEFPGEPMPPFVHQHGLRLHAPGSLLLLDNIGNPTESLAKRYTFDAATHSAHLMQSYGWPSVVTEIGGSVQDVAGGRTLVSFGTAGRVEEYDAAGRVTWRIDGNAGYIFRAQRIRSLYAPGVGTPR